MPWPEKLMLEVCVDSLNSARAAIEGGADRLEICGVLGAGGGVSPSPGLVLSIQELAKFCGKSVDLMVMIRPRIGDFCYSIDEQRTMAQDIKIYGQYGVKGVVLGALKADGSIDIECMEKLLEEASLYDMDVTFHRAIDLCIDPFSAISDIINLGRISRILTSGHNRRAVDSLDTLTEYSKATKGTSVSIMPGSGVNTLTAEQIVRQLLPFGLREIHMSGGKWKDGSMLYRRDNLGMGLGGDGEWGVWTTDSSSIEQVRSKIDSIGLLADRRD